MGSAHNCRAQPGPASLLGRSGESLRAGQCWIPELGSSRVDLGMKCHAEFLSWEPPDPQLQGGPQMGESPQDSPPPFLPGPLRYTQSQACSRLAIHSRPSSLDRRAPRPVPRVRAAAPPPPPQSPGYRADSPPLAGPGCARAAWLPAGAPKPSSFSMPAISLSCWARKAAAGSSSATSGAPLSDDEKKPKSSAIFPASLLKRPPGPWLCPARAPRCARRPRHCHPSRLGEPASAGTGSARRPRTSSLPPGPASLSLRRQAGGAGTGMR